MSHVSKLKFRDDFSIFSDWCGNCGPPPESEKFKPKLSTHISVLKQVEDHFLQHQKIDIKTLSLYHSLLKTSKSEVLAFLNACLSNETEQLYYEMPLELISQIHGRPCRIRDFEEGTIAHTPLNNFSRVPTMLVCDHEFTRLYVRGVEVGKIDVTGLIAAVPTSSTLEQHAVICKQNGVCTLVSTTRKSVVIVAEFKLDVPENEIISWIDIVTVDSKTVLFWGGCDPLRGQATWSFSSGLSISDLMDSENEAFFDFQDCEKLYEGILDLATREQDFSKHGNVLTLWTRYIDEEVANQRVWVKQSSLHHRSRVFRSAGYEDCTKTDLVSVWGTPQQYVAIDCEGLMTHWIVEGKNIIERSRLKTPHRPVSMCLLYAHSR